MVKRRRRRRNVKRGGGVPISTEFAKVREVMFEYLMVKFITVADREED